jgi:hypothetical protein
MSSLLVLGLGLFVAPACGEPSATTPPTAVKQDDTKAAVAVAEAWLKSIDADDYAGSWDQAASYFRQAVTKEQWITSLDGVRKPLGALTSRRVSSAEPATRLPGAPDGKYVVIQFQTSFANKQSAIETVTPMLDTDGAWHVSGYFIR